MVLLIALLLHMANSCSASSVNVKEELPAGVKERLSVAMPGMKAEDSGTPLNAGVVAESNSRVEVRRSTLLHASHVVTRVR